jgi:uncharacterized membrane protein
MSRLDQSLWAIFRTPLVVAVLSLGGLLLALFIDGPGDVVASALLASVVLVTAWALVRRRC